MVGLSARYFCSALSRHGGVQACPLQQLLSLVSTRGTWKDREWFGEEQRTQNHPRTVEGAAYTLSVRHLYTGGGGRRLGHGLCWFLVQGFSRGSVQGLSRGYP